MCVCVGDLQNLLCAVVRTLPSGPVLSFFSANLIVPEVWTRLTTWVRDQKISIKQICKRDRKDDQNKNIHSEEKRMWKGQ